MYTTYELQVYDYVQEKWVRVAHMEASNMPHYYDDLRDEFVRLVRSASEGASANQKPIGYRIVNGFGGIYDVWTNGKVEEK